MDQNLRATAEFLSKLRSVERVGLLAVHEYGKVKYAQLGRENKLHNVLPMSQERLREIKALFERYGLRIQLGG